ncbi:MAG TPA: hypothetical protein VN893_00695 [Bryobacteraceae bacterium]|nr:hypothetical protein [Bryobacteraceae bacterium]
MTRIRAVLLLAVALPILVRAETLGSVLRSRHVPTNQFSDSDLAGPISGWAASNDDDPFLLAYYAVDPPRDPLGPLRVIRYDPATRDLRRGEFPKASARSSFDQSISCLLPVLAIGEHQGVIHIATNGNSAPGCTLVLSTQLALRTAVSGRPLGWVGSDYSVVQRGGMPASEIDVYDLRHDLLTAVYPPFEDDLRQQFAGALQAGSSGRARPFSTELVGQVSVNEPAKVFGFVVQYDAGGFGEKTATPVEPLAVAYVYRLRRGRWEHREILPERLMDLFGVETVGELVRGKPQAAFEALKAPQERPARPGRSRPGSLP